MREMKTPSWYALMYVTPAYGRRRPLSPPVATRYLSHLMASQGKVRVSAHHACLADPRMCPLGQCCKELSKGNEHQKSLHAP